MDKVKQHITIRTSDEKEQMTIANSIHENLRGNQDYIDSNIVLNIDVDNEVNIYVFEECKEIPSFGI